MTEYKEAMERALELARRGTGYVSPNPRVGAVILNKNGEKISEGWHKSFGGLHAEVEAINASKIKSFEGYTLVVNLEPCVHKGKTPPCTDLIIAKKFSRVVIGTLDPNPLVAGKGAEKLKNAGVEVIIGVLEPECYEINRTFFKYITKNQAYITLKVAQSIDGNIALRNGQSKWLTSEESRYAVQVLRSESDAILVGKNTVLMDNPFLTVRELDLPSPKKVILDSELSLPLDLNIFRNGDRDNTILFCNEKVIDSRKAKTLSLAGVHIEPLSANTPGYLNLKDVIDVLTKKYNLTSVLVEGGSQIFSNFIKEKLVDEIHLFVAPIIVGEGIQSFRNLNFSALLQAPQIKVTKFENIGSDFHIVGTMNFQN